MLYFMGLKTILTILKPVLPVQAHFNSLSVSAFVCIWADLAVKPIAPVPGVQHLRLSGTTRKGLKKFLINITLEFQKCRLQCDLLFTE